MKTYKTLAVKLESKCVSKGRQFLVLEGLTSYCKLSPFPSMACLTVLNALLDTHRCKTYTQTGLFNLCPAGNNDG